MAGVKGKNGGRGLTCPCGKAGRFLARKLEHLVQHREKLSSFLGLASGKDVGEAVGGGLGRVESGPLQSLPNHCSLISHHSSNKQTKFSPSPVSQPLPYVPTLGYLFFLISLFPLALAPAQGSCRCPKEHDFWMLVLHISMQYLLGNFLDVEFLSKYTVSPRRARNILMNDTFTPFHWFLNHPQAIPPTFLVLPDSLTICERSCSHS